MHELFKRGVSDPLGIPNVDVVVVDMPPLNTLAATALVAGLADGVVLVADGKRLRGGPISRAKEALDRANARIVGVVLNRVQSSQTQWHEINEDEVGATDDYGVAIERHSSSGVALLTNGLMKQSATEEIGPPQSHGIAQS